MAPQPDAREVAALCKGPRRAHRWARR